MTGSTSVTVEWSGLKDMKRRKLTGSSGDPHLRAFRNGGGEGIGAGNKASDNFSSLLAAIVLAKETWRHVIPSLCECPAEAGEHIGFISTWLLSQDGQGGSHQGEKHPEGQLWRKDGQQPHICMAQTALPAAGC